MCTPVGDAEFAGVSDHKAAGFRSLVATIRS